MAENRSHLAKEALLPLIDDSLEASSNNIQVSADNPTANITINQDVKTKNKDLQIPQYYIDR